MNESIRVVISDSDFSGLAGSENLSERIKAVVRAELAANRATQPANQADETTPTPAQPDAPAVDTGGSSDLSPEALAEILSMLGR